MASTRQTHQVRPCSDFKRILSANSSAASWSATIIPTVTAPLLSTDGVWNMKMPGGPSYVSEKILFTAYLIGAENTTGTFRLWGWHTIERSGATTLYVPVLLAQIVATASTAVGIASAAVLNTERFADTLVVTTAGTTVTCSPATDGVANVAGFVEITNPGFKLVQWDFNDGGSSTSGNGLFAVQ